ncbi:MAG: C-terminal helicase domain-containing protein [Thermomicrobiales bacterium]
MKRQRLSRKSSDDSRFSDEPPSIGVVTFNIQQRNLIDSLLRDSGNQRILDALEDTDGLFVKNLENVQGDERDAIFFSTAFSVNERGVLPLNFGPLNRIGGERRLNVAITRARRQVVVFSSFDPEQLRAEETSSVGVKHLRAYLDIAAAGLRELPSEGRPRSAIDRHREEIATALRERGMSCGRTSGCPISGSISCFRPRTGRNVL